MYDLLKNFQKKKMAKFIAILLIIFGVIDLFIGFGLFFLFTNDGNTIMNIPHPQMVGVQVILISIVSIGFGTVILSLLTKKL